MRISANIGFLWDHLPLVERITAAAAAGFDAVECHFPYEVSAATVKETLQQCQLPMVGLNTALGPEGNFGLASVPGQETHARALIDQAVDYAECIDADNINVVAGLTQGDPNAENVYRENLRYASERAGKYNRTILIEPLNPRAVAGYHLYSVEQAMETIAAVESSIAAGNIKLMLDFFHAQIVHGDLETLIKSHIDAIGHIQISAVHDRGEPDDGEINYPYLLQVLANAGYTGYIGAEYKPRGSSVEEGLSWLDDYR